MIAFWEIVCVHIKVELIGVVQVYQSGPDDKVGENNPAGRTSVTVIGPVIVLVGILATVIEKTPLSGPMTKSLSWVLVIARSAPLSVRAVSYTHLTLPTILLV